MAINCALHGPTIRQQQREEKQRLKIKKQRDSDLNKIAKEYLNWLKTH